jgi:long-chain acyl-CoA synthetase
LVDNICVVGDSEHTAPVALVAVNHSKLLAAAQSAGINGDIDTIVNDPAVEKLVIQSLNTIASHESFEKWERVMAVKLYSEPWTPASGLLTEAMKLKRHEVNKRFKEDIDKMYKKK